MAPRTIFFDFGGTLVEPVRDRYPIVAAVLGSRGFPLELESYDRANAEVSRSLGPFLDRYLGKGRGYWDEYQAQLLRQLGIAEHTAELVHSLHEAFTSPEVHRPYPEADGVLRRIHGRNLTLHVLSNNTELLPETIGRLGWSRWISTVTYSQEAGTEKPDARIFQLALHRAHCSARAALHVGDSWEADVLGAQAVGIPTLWVDRAGRGPRHGSLSVRDLRGVLDYLDAAP